MMFGYKERLTFSRFSPIIVNLECVSPRAILALRHLRFGCRGSAFASAMRPIRLGSAFALGGTLCVLRTQRVELRR